MVLLDWPPPDHLGIGRKRGNSCQRTHPAEIPFRLQRLFAFELRRWERSSSLVSLTCPASQSRLWGHVPLARICAANRYDFHAIWSPNSRFVVELLDFRWSTEALRLYSFIQHGTPVLSLDLKPIMELAVRRELRKTMKNEASYAFEIQGDNSGEPPRLSIDNDGMIRTRIEMQVPKEDLKTIYVDVLLQVSWRDGALHARPLRVRKSDEKN
jgi:hypothetical protein